MPQSRPRFLLPLWLIGIAGFLCFPSSAASPVAPAGVAAQAWNAPVTITLLGTTDLHGNLAPWDYYADTPANRGLEKIATLVRRVRAEQPHTLLLDSGDTIQGTPLAYYFGRKDTSK